MKSNVNTKTNNDIKYRNSIDGLWDLAIGLALLFVGFAFLFDVITIAGGLCFSIFLLILWLKQKVVYPRIGYKKHNVISIKPRKTMSFSLIICIAILFVLFLLYLKFNGGDSRVKTNVIIVNLGGLILGFIIAFTMIFLAKTFSISRFYWYSPIMFIAFLAIALVDYEYIIPISFLSSGAILFTIGLIVFIKFIKAYPKLEYTDN